MLGLSSGDDEAQLLHWKTPKRAWFSQIYVHHEKAWKTSWHKQVNNSLMEVLTNMPKIYPNNEALTVLGKNMQQEGTISKKMEGRSVGIPCSWKGAIVSWPIALIKLQQLPPHVTKLLPWILIWVLNNNAIIVLPIHLNFQLLRVLISRSFEDWGWKHFQCHPRLAMATSPRISCPLATCCCWSL